MSKRYTDLVSWWSDKNHRKCNNSNQNEVVFSSQHHRGEIRWHGPLLQFFKVIFRTHVIPKSNVWEKIRFWDHKNHVSDVLCNHRNSSKFHLKTPRNRISGTPGFKIFPWEHAPDPLAGLTHLAFALTFQKYGPGWLCHCENVFLEINRKCVVEHSKMCFLKLCRKVCKTYTPWCAIKHTLVCN